MKDIVTIVITVLLFNSCKKEEPKQYSNWTVDGKEYSSNNIDFSIGKEIAVINSKDINDWFKLIFYGYYPKAGDFLPIRRNNDSINPNYIVLSFYINNKYYGIDNDTSFLQKIVVNGKHSYKLSKTWYSHYEGGNKDSVQIDGTFNEP